MCVKNWTEKKRQNAGGGAFLAGLATFLFPPLHFIAFHGDVTWSEIGTAPAWVFTLMVIGFTVAMAGLIILPKEGDKIKKEEQEQ